MKLPEFWKDVMDIQKIGRSLNMSYHDALLSVAMNYDIAFFPIKIDVSTSDYISLPKSGDLIIGFMSPVDIEFEILFNDTCVAVQQLTKNGFFYPRCNIIPLGWLTYHDVKIKIITDSLIESKLCIIYGLQAVSDDYNPRYHVIRADFMNSENDDIDTIIYSSGLYNKFSGSESINPEYPIDYKFPLINTNLEKYKKKKTQELVNNIREELMEITWHPDRLSWVLDIHEKKRFKM